MALPKPIGRQYGSSSLPDDLILMESGDQEIAAGQPDPRGYELWGQDNQKIGTIHSLLGSPATGRAYFALVDAGGMFHKRRYLIPIEMLSIDPNDERAFVPFTTAEFSGAPEYQEGSRGYQRYYDYWSGYAPAASTAAASTTAATTQVDQGVTREMRVPVTEEEAQIRKEQREVGHITLRKRVDVETQHISEPVSRTHVEVERHAVPADQQRAYATGDATVLKEGETIRVPVMAEELVVEKVPRVTEEVVIRRDTDTRQVEQDVQLRRERVEVDEEGDVDLDTDTPAAPRRNT